MNWKVNVPALGQRFRLRVKLVSSTSEQPTTSSCARKREELVKDMPLVSSPMKRTKRGPILIPDYITVIDGNPKTYKCTICSKNVSIKGQTTNNKVVSCAPTVV
ncbi:unnamed protein product [Orchesella dallaii]|uniref:Uncharacterized protein n=1 Tax=Orchesella dallaii TaxID=48710 RepID=A0ABP1RS76_9HEXA